MSNAGRYLDGVREREKRREKESGLTQGRERERKQKKNNAQDRFVLRRQGGEIPGEVQVRDLTQMSDSAFVTLLGDSLRALLQNLVSVIFVSAASSSSRSEMPEEHLTVKAWKRP